MDIYCFIDSQNLNLAINDCGWKINWYRLRRYLTDKYGITRAFMFLGFIKSNQRLYDDLKKAGYELIFKPVIQTKVKIKGNVDAELVLWTMHYIKDYDKAVIITGDGDFYCLVDYLENRNKLLSLGIPNKQAFSPLLRKFIPQKAFFVSNLRNKIEYLPKI